MATRSYYYQSGNNYHESPNSPPVPLHLCFFLLLLLSFMAFSWYMNYESILEDFFDRLKLFFILSPLLLLAAVHFYLAYGDDRRRVPLLISLPADESFHPAGGSPWGIAFLLVLLLTMVSYQSYFHESWFPFFRHQR